MDFVKLEERIKELYAGKGFVQNEVGKLKAQVSYEFVNKDLLTESLQVEHDTHNKFTA